jgi:hypothetical protein
MPGANAQDVKLGEMNPTIVPIDRMLLCLFGHRHQTKNRLPGFRNTQSLRSGMKDEPSLLFASG